MTEQNSAPPVRRGRGRPPKEAAARQAIPGDDKPIDGDISRDVEMRHVAPPRTVTVEISGGGGTGYGGSGGGGGGAREPSVRDLRGDMRAEDPRAAADERAREILEHLKEIDNGTDEFQISESMIPDGWTYEWKRRFIMGKPDPAYEVSLRQTGWQDVPASRHPEMMPMGSPIGASIERKGMVLMERPKQITDRILGRDAQRARDQVRVKEQQLSQTPQGHFDRTEDRRTAPNIKKSYEPMAVPTDK